MDGEPPSPSVTAMQPRQKRVQPSRSKSKRVGTGVGSSEIDIMILETQKRKHESEPLLPALTKFLLTTNSTLDSPSTSTSSQFNIVATERYFSRPEVLESFRQKVLIETPEFVKKPETGGRLRAKSLSGGKGDDEEHKTADEVFAKRHSKFEQFEKRGRVREREKLQHEHYKLKERIEQLRLLDGAAFMGLSAEYFTNSPQQAEDNRQPDSDALDAGSAAFFGSLNIEGERRRREMLNTALGIEERYRILLPPKQKKTEAQSTLPAADGGDRHIDLEETPLAEALQIRVSSRPNVASAVGPRPDSTKKSRKSVAPPSTQAASSHKTRVSEEHAHGDTTESEVEHEAPDGAAPTPDSKKRQKSPTRNTRQTKSARSASVGHQEAATPPTEASQPASEAVATEEVAEVKETKVYETRRSSGRPHKRPRLSPDTTTASASPAPSGGKEMSLPLGITAPSYLSERRSYSRASTAQPGRLQKPCILVHYAEQVKGSKTRRQVLAFGAPLPSFSENVEYDLPYWIWPPPDVN